MNRTIASGIFKYPGIVLGLVDNPALALLLWVAAGIIALSVVLVWVELGLTVPLQNIILDGINQRVSTPRSGGDKNYVNLLCPLFSHRCVTRIRFMF
jgi:hypothetical protein